jgi:hypothetical protein
VVLQTYIGVAGHRLYIKKAEVHIVDNGIEDQRKNYEHCRKNKCPAEKHLPFLQIQGVGR